jgi:AcrR family transcriptional regulator
VIPEKRRRYELRQRAERQDVTRGRIVAAAVELHTTVGPARTTDVAIAERAGVTRRTFYRHFPDELTLFRACTSHGLVRWPPPAPERWDDAASPEDRLRAALKDLFEYYAVAGPGLLVIGRDMPLLSPEIRALPSRADVLRELPNALLEGWTVRGRARDVLRAALQHATAVPTWDSLVRQRELTVEEAVELLVALVLAAARA